MMTRICLSDVRTGKPSKPCCNPECMGVLYPRTVFVMDSGKEYCCRECLLACEQSVLDDDSPGVDDEGDS